jgi:formylglycine-generating enzyme
MRGAVLAISLAAALAPWVQPAEAKGKAKGCPGDMVSVQGQFCIDRYEAYVVEVDGKKTRPHSPYEPVTGLTVKAMNGRGKVPQAYISRNEAEMACANAGKRLCRDDEWLAACKGKRPTQWPYGDERQPRRCNDSGTSSFNLLFGKDGQPPPLEDYTFDRLNDPRLNKMTGTVAKAGSFSRCKNGYGVFDMVGNLHEWTSAASGTFRGGYYLDVEQNGLGCDYKTTAHHDKYHDYSTGFRCCVTPGEKHQPMTAQPRPKPGPAKGAKAEKSAGPTKLAKAPVARP